MRKSQSGLLIFTLNCLIIFSVSEIVCHSQIYSSSIKEKFNFHDEYIVSEKTYLHADRSVYVTGENIFFKVYYFLNGTFKKDSVSSIVYVDLVDENGQVQADGKYPVENGMANGNLLIQEGLISGYYTIYAYTKWMMNFGKDCFFSKKIYIINPESELKILKTSNPDNILLNFSAEGGYLKIDRNKTLSVGKFQIETLSGKERYHAREKVNVKITTVSPDKNMKNTHLSVSIAKSDLLNIDTNNISGYLDYRHRPANLSGLNSDTIQHSSEIVYIPETSGLIISGTIQSTQTNKPIPDVNIYLSTLSNHIDVQNAITKKDGKFYFLMNEKVKNTDFVIQPADKSLKNFKVILDKGSATEYPSDSINTLRENGFDKKLFKDLVINHQIEKQYYPYPPADSKIMNNTTLFYGKADTSYSFQKFIDLPTFEEYFVEIFSQTKIVKVENGKQIKLNYLDSRIELKQLPLLLVDGIPIFDVDKFLSISPSEIDKVEIINDYYVLGGIIYGGIIHLYTKRKNFGSLIDTKNLSFYKFTGFTEKNKFREIKYTDEIPLESRKADYRNTLYWNPEIVTDENGEAHFSFYTSDERGKFLITIEGVEENGKTGSKQMVLEVE